jgi:hypothetical protein
MPRLDRRDFLKLLGATGLQAALPWPVSAQQGFEPYTGPLFVSISARGAWDVTSLCDPKADATVNHWAADGTGAAVAGNIRYAPWAANAETFFTAFRDHMLVLNGIDTGTNAHDAGVTHSWSGRSSEGYPSWPALCAAVRGPLQPIAMLYNGGYGETAGVIRYSRVLDPSDLGRLVNSEYLEERAFGQPVYEKRFYLEEDLDRIRAWQASRMAASRADGTRLPRQRHASDALYLARLGTAELDVLGELLAAETLRPDPLQRQAQIALLSYRAGLTVSADLQLGGFDTHDDHDARHKPLLERLLAGVLFLFQRAGELGVSDRLVVVLGSDFSRTPRYNDVQGKDHHPIGSAIVLKENAPWGNQVFGETDGGHLPLAVDPTTGQASPSGVRIAPAHLHDLLRRLAGVESDPLCARFPLELAPAEALQPARWQAAV